MQDKPHGAKLENPPKLARMTLRVISRNSKGEITEIREQEMPATEHEAQLFLRRAFVSEQVARTMLAFSGSITIERTK